MRIDTVDYTYIFRREFSGEPAVAFHQIIKILIFPRIWTAPDPVYFTHTLIEFIVIGAV